MRQSFQRCYSPAVLTLALCAWAVDDAQSQRFTLSPVHWSAESSLPPKLQPGSRFNVLLHAAIDDGWHLYALQEADAFPLATEIALQKGEPAELLRVDQLRPRHVVDPESHVVTNSFTGSTTFTLRLASTTEPPMRGLHVLVQYQACNDRLCLPPRNELVPVLFRTTR